LFSPPVKSFGYPAKTIEKSVSSIYNRCILHSERGISVQDFDFILLSVGERFKLFCMRFKKRVSKRFLGKHLDYPRAHGLIRANYSDEKNAIGEFLWDGIYSLTDLYRRYRRYRRHVFYHSFALPIIISIATVAVLQWLGLQESTSPSLPCQPLSSALHRICKGIHQVLDRLLQLLP